MSYKECETKRKKILLRKLTVKAVELRVVISSRETWKINVHTIFLICAIFSEFLGSLIYLFSQRLSGCCEYRVIEVRLEFLFKLLIPLSDCICIFFFCHRYFKNYFSLVICR